MIAAPTAHPSKVLLAAFASGWLPASADLCVEAHLEGCVACRRAVEVLGSEEEAFIDGLPDAPLEPSALTALLDRLDAIPLEAAPRRDIVTLDDVALPAALSRFALAARRWIRPGLWVSHLRMETRDDWRTYVLRAPAGERLPAHGHSGPELVCVLTGAFNDGTTTYRAGDFVEASRLDHHRLVVTDDGPCACLIATKGRLVLRGAAQVVGHTLKI